MKRSFYFAIFAAACSSVEPSSVVTAVGIKIGDGPHQGIVQEQAGVKVEVVPMPDGTVRAYLADTSGQPQKATGEVKMTISADAFSPTEVVMSPAEDGAYLVGKLPGPAPTTPANLAIVFPAGLTYEYSAVAFSPSVVVAAPVVDVTVAGVPVGFKAPNGGTITRVGDNIVEVVIQPKGEVHAYAYTLDAQPIPIAEIQIPEVEIQYEQKPYKVKLKQHVSEPYFVGVIDAKVSIPAQAEVVIVAPQPIQLRGVVYQPTAVVFAPIIVAAPIVVVSAPVLVVPPPPVVVPPVGVHLVTPGVVITPPRIDVNVGIGIGIGIGGKVGHKSNKAVGYPTGYKATPPGYKATPQKKGSYKKSHKGSNKGSNKGSHKGNKGSNKGKY
jgi:hypothetical protein